MTILYTDPLFLRHNTGNHPECPARLESIAGYLTQTGLGERCARPSWSPATVEQVARVHDPAYVAQLQRFAAEGGGQIEIDTVVSRESYDVALWAAGTVCDAVGRVIRGEDRQALCLVRPPGHHALVDGPMGFCLFNNIAVGARAALQEWGLGRVLIVDWDVHHGNGTQDAFWESDQVGFLSIHRWPFYPGTGASDETGAGPGLGYTVNLPITYGTPRDKYLALFRSALEAFAARLRPELLLISAGFDSHRLDPVGSLGLEVEDFATLTRTVLEVSQAYCGGKLVSVLEGGYNTDVLPQCVGAHLTALLAASTAG